MAITISGTNGIVGAGFTVDNSGVSVTAGVGTFASIGTGVSVSAAGLTGALPTISAANCTNLPAANLTGTLPAISGANLTGISGGLAEADAWRITSNFQNNDYHIESNWERMDSQTEGKKGTGMTQSSGLFTFPATGYYYIHFMVAGYRGGDGTTINPVSYIRTTTSGDTSSGTYYNGSGRQSMRSESGNSSYSLGNTTIFKCSNTSNDKIFFGVQTGDSSVYVQGSSTENFTYAIFIKLADI